jgi:hypothetical protein
MSLPKITTDISGYNICLGSEKITIECRRLSLHSGEIKGEICISSNALVINASHLHRANFNFSSDTARDRLATSLGKRMGSRLAGYLRADLRIYNGITFAGRNY